MTKVDLVVFDMAGTTVNEDNIVYKTVQKAINKKGYNLALDTVLEHGAGKEKHQAIKDILAHVDGAVSLEKAADIFKDFKGLLQEAYKELEVTTYPGVTAMLAKLRESQIKIALNTGYNTEIATLLLQKMGWSVGKEYDVLVTADDVTNGRPNPDMIYKAMELVGVQDAVRVLKAGDSVIDIEEGKNAHCGFTVGVTTGAHTKNQLATAQPTFILDSLQGLAEMLID